MGGTVAVQHRMPGAVVLCALGVGTQLLGYHMAAPFVATRIGFPPAKRDEAVAWAASFIHAIFATILSAVMYSSIPDTYPEDLSRWGEQILESKLIYFTAAVFNSYFATDAVHYWRSKTLSINEVAIHHAIFLTVGAVNFVSPLFPGSFAVPYGGEFST